MRVVISCRVYSGRGNREGPVCKLSLPVSLANSAVSFVKLSFCSTSSLKERKKNRVRCFTLMIDG